VQIACRAGRLPRRLPWISVSGLRARIVETTNGRLAFSALAAAQALEQRDRSDARKQRRGLGQEMRLYHRDLRAIGLVRLAEVLRLEREHVLAPPGPARPERPPPPDVG